MGKDESEGVKTGHEGSERGMMGQDEYGGVRTGQDCIGQVKTG